MFRLSSSTQQVLISVFRQRMLVQVSYRVQCITYITIRVHDSAKLIEKIYSVNDGREIGVRCFGLQFNLI